jgi:hypothetical protein
MRFQIILNGVSLGCAVVTAILLFNLSQDNQTQLAKNKDLVTKVVERDMSIYLLDRKLRNREEAIKQIDLEWRDKHNQSMAVCRAQKKQIEKLENHIKLIEQAEFLPLPATESQTKQLKR